MKLHNLEPTDTEGHAYQCMECGVEVGPNEEQDGECKGEKRIYASASFSGCSCGCTLGGSLEVGGKRENVIRRLADYYSEHSLYGSKPYSKLYLSQGEELKAEVEALADKLNDIKNEVYKWESKIEKNGDLKWEVEKAAKILGIDIPEEKLKQIENIPADDEVSNKEIKKLNDKMGVMLDGIWDLDTDEEEEDENEG